MTKPQRHKTFISYHHERDQEYADKLRITLGDDIIDKSVKDGDFSDDLSTSKIWTGIRKNHQADATVTVVIAGVETAGRKYVDWEIGSSLNESPGNSRCGVLVIRTPDHPDYGNCRPDSSTLPPRLAENIHGDDPYVQVYDWPADGDLSEIPEWIDRAFQRRSGPPPNNNSPRFQRNRPLKEPPISIKLDTLAIFDNRPVIDLDRPKKSTGPKASRGKPRHSIFKRPSSRKPNPHPFARRGEPGGGPPRRRRRRIVR